MKTHTLPAASPPQEPGRLAFLTGPYKRKATFPDSLVVQVVGVCPRRACRNHLSIVAWLYRRRTVVKAAAGAACRVPVRLWRVVAVYVLVRCCFDRDTISRSVAAQPEGGAYTGACPTLPLAIYHVSVVYLNLCGSTVL